MGRSLNNRRDHAWISNLPDRRDPAYPGGQRRTPPRVGRQLGAMAGVQRLLWAVSVTSKTS